jgi:hypothetical protein
MRVVDVSSAWEEQYESFLLHHPFALLYYSLRYRGFLADLLGCKSRYAAAVEGDEIRAVLPLMVADGRFGQVVNSLPYYGSNGGILATDDHASTVLADWYGQEVADAGIAAATVIANPLDPEPQAVVHDVVDLRVGHVTALDGPDSDGEDPLWQAIDGSARRNVKKAAQAGVEVSVENDAFADLERLHRASMSVAGGAPKSPSFFRAIPAHFREGLDYRIYVGRVGGDAVAALLLFYYGDTVEYYVPALAPDFRPAQPMAAILFQAMTDAAHAGCRRWNWGGSWLTHDTLIRFKSKWGGRGRTYQYWTKVNRPELRSATPHELQDEYDGFFVLPFSELDASHG